MLSLRNKLIVKANQMFTNRNTSFVGNNNFICTRTHQGQENIDLYLSVSNPLLTYCLFEFTALS